MSPAQAARLHRIDNFMVLSEYHESTSTVATRAVRTHSGASRSYSYGLGQAALVAGAGVTHTGPAAGA